MLCDPKAEFVRDFTDAIFCARTGGWRIGPPMTPAARKIATAIRSQIPHHLLND